MTLCYENKEFVLDNPIPKVDMETTNPKEIVANKQHVGDVTKVACVMIATMVPNQQKYDENYCLFEMNLALAEIFHKKSRQERFEVMKSLMACKIKEGKYVSTHVKKMQETCGKDREAQCEFRQRVSH